MSPQVQALLAAVPDLVALSPADLPASVALADCRASLLALLQLQGVLTRQLTDVHTRGLYDLESAGSVGVWAARQEAPPPSAQVSLAKAVVSHPHVQAALLGGALSREAAAAVTSALGKARPFLDRPDGLIDGVDGEAALGNVVLRGVLGVLGREHGGTLGATPERDALIGRLLAVQGSPTCQADRLEQAFVVAAEHLPARRVGPALGLLLDALLPQQLADRSQDAHDHRGLDLRHRLDGGWLLKGELDDLTGEMLHTALAAMQAVDPDNPSDTQAWADLRRGEQGDQQHLGAHDVGASARSASDVRVPAPRSRRRRLHDALHLLLDRVLGGGLLGDRDKVAPHVVITVPVDAVHDAPGALPAVTDSGASLPAGLARQVLCDSRLTRVVLDLASRPLDISHTERTLRPHERRALLTRWGGRCAGATCGSPPGTALIPHHVEGFAGCGTTSYSDSVPLCLADHTHLHRGATLGLRDGRLLAERGFLQQRVTVRTGG